MPENPFAPSRRAYVILSVLWCVAALAVKPFYPYVDFAAFYATAIDKILAGAPLDIYSFVARPPGSDLALALAHPPLWLFLLAPWYALGRAFGIDDFHNAAGISVGQAWMLVVALPIDLLLCRTIVRLSEARQRLPEPQRLVLFACLLFSPLLWLSSVRYGHNESWMVLAILLAVAAGERGKPVVSGLLWGVALQFKMTAIAPALVYYGWGLGRERWRSTAVSAPVAAAAFVLPLLPYVLYGREAVEYALVGFERIRPIGGYVSWKVFPALASMASVSNLLILLSCAAIGIVLALRPGKSFVEAGGAWALLLSQALLLLFAKALFVWYGLAASCFLYWAWMRDRRTSERIPLVPLAASLLLWLVPSGGWVGESVTSMVRIRSAVWVVLTLSLAGLALREIFGGMKVSELTGKAQ